MSETIKNDYIDNKYVIVKGLKALNLMADNGYTLHSDSRIGYICELVDKKKAEKLYININKTVRTVMLISDYKKKIADEEKAKADMELAKQKLIDDAEKKKADILKEAAKVAQSLKPKPKKSKKEIVVKEEPKKKATKTVAEKIVETLSKKEDKTEEKSDE